MMVLEAWIPEHRLPLYIGPEEAHQSFNFGFLQARWGVETMRAAIEKPLALADAVGAPTTWVLSNHDVIRHATRYGFPPEHRFGEGLSREEVPDAELGLLRARAATLLMLGLPGSAYLYQGEELGLPEHTTLDDKWRQDPAFFRTEGAETGRDGCRIPLPWESDAPAYGFSPTGESWLPQPALWAELAADRQAGDPASTLSLYRRALQLRREWELGQGSWTFQEQGEDVVCGVNECAAGPRLVLTTLGAGARVPDGWKVALCSDPQLELSVGMELPADTTVWCVPEV